MANLLNLALGASPILARGAASYLQGKDVGEQRRKAEEERRAEREQERARQALQDRLLEGQITATNARTARDDELAPLRSGLLDAQTAATQALAEARNRPETQTRNIDPLSPEGIEATLRRERQLSGIPPRRTPSTSTTRPDRTKWVDTEARKLAGQTDPLTGLRPDFQEALSEANRRYDQLYPAAPPASRNTSGFREGVGAGAAALRAFGPKSARVERPVASASAESPDLLPIDEIAATVSDLPPAEAEALLRSAGYSDAEIARIRGTRRP